MFAVIKPPCAADPISASLSILSEKELYNRFLDSLDGFRPTHIIGLPWVRRGGADLGALHFANTLAGHLNKRVLVVTTLNCASPWIGKFHERIRIWELGRQIHTLPHDRQCLLLEHLLSALSADVIHVMNSALFWSAFKRYGRKLATLSKLYTAVYCDDYYPNGTRFSYARTYLPHTYMELQAITSDNRKYPQELSRDLDIPLSRFRTVYFPTTIPKQATEYKNHDAPRVLFAGRLDRQKRPDLMMAIARDMPDVCFEIFGDLLLDKDLHNCAGLESLSNVVIHGPYDGFDSLPVERFAAFLYTSAWDGLPNVLLEAAAHGLPTVAANAGAVSEIIDRSSGLLVEHPDSVHEYVRLLRWVINDRPKAMEQMASIREVINRRHSQGHFLQSLKEIPGYV
jgi:glycosyltransferase involved in cell wall biosynthesis